MNLKESLFCHCPCIWVILFEGVFTNIYEKFNLFPFFFSASKAMIIYTGSFLSTLNKCMKGKKGFEEFFSIKRCVSTSNFSLFYFMSYVFTLLKTNKQKGHCNFCSQIFSLASNGRPSLQAEVKTGMCWVGLRAELGGVLIFS